MTETVKSLLEQLAETDQLLTKLSGLKLSQEEQEQTQDLRDSIRNSVAAFADQAKHEEEIQEHYNRTFFDKEITERAENTANDFSEYYLQNMPIIQDHIRNSVEALSEAIDAQEIKDAQEMKNDVERDQDGNKMEDSISSRANRFTRDHHAPKEELVSASDVTAKVVSPETARSQIETGYNGLKEETERAIDAGAPESFRDNVMRSADSVKESSDTLVEHRVSDYTKAGVKALADKLQPVAEFVDKSLGAAIHAGIEFFRKSKEDVTNAINTVKNKVEANHEATWAIAQEKIAQKERRTLAVQYASLIMARDKVIRKAQKLEMKLNKSIMRAQRKENIKVLGDNLGHLLKGEYDKIQPPKKIDPAEMELQHVIANMYREADHLDEMANGVRVPRLDRDGNLMHRITVDENGKKHEEPIYENERKGGIAQKYRESQMRSRENLEKALKTTEEKGMSAKRDKDGERVNRRARILERLKEEKDNIQLGSRESLTEGTESRDHETINRIKADHQGKRLFKDAAQLAKDRAASSTGRQTDEKSSKKQDGKER